MHTVRFVLPEDARRFRAHAFNRAFFAAIVHEGCFSGYHLMVFATKKILGDYQHSRTVR
jgi:hypothetical protein